MSLLLAALADADAGCLDAAELLLDSIETLPSVAALGRLEKRIDEALARLGSASPETSFERSYARHLKASWRLLLAIARYRFEWPRADLGEILDALAGPEASRRLEDAVSGIDPEQVVRYLELRRRYRRDRVEPSRPDVRERLESYLQRLAGEFRRWLAAREGDLPGLDAEVTLGQGDARHSVYEPARRRVVIGPGEFMIFEREGRLTVNPVVALHAMAHELAGHAVQDALSRDLPGPLRPDHRARMRFACLPAAEGFAHHRSQLAFCFAWEKAGDLGLHPEDLLFLEAVVTETTVHYALPACAGALAARARREPGFDAAGRLAEITGHAGHGEMLSRASDEPLNRTLYTASCFFGSQAVGEAAAHLWRQGLRAEEISRALGTGGWALPHYLEAIGNGAAKAPVRSESPVASSPDGKPPGVS